MEQNQIHKTTKSQRNILENSAIALTPKIPKEGAVDGQPNSLLDTMEGMAHKDRSKYIKNSTRKYHIPTESSIITYQN